MDKSALRISANWSLAATRAGRTCQRKTNSADLSQRRLVITATEAETNTSAARGDGAAHQTNQEWAIDFVHDAAGNGQTLRFFAVVDQFSRTCIRLVVDTSIPAARVVRELTAAIAEHGKPERIRMDNGSEFTGRNFLVWCVEQKIETVHIRPGKPVENAHSESFNGKLREEFLNVTHFRHLWEAQAMTARWLEHCNGARPHSSLDYKTLNEFARAYSALRAPQALANSSSTTTC